MKNLTPILSWLQVHLMPFPGLPELKDGLWNMHAIGSSVTLWPGNLTGAPHLGFGFIILWWSDRFANPIIIRWQNIKIDNISIFWDMC